MIKVLYVDDDESFCGFFKIYLEKNEDIIVTTVQSGLAALEMILSGSHDIVISDYSMPGMSGMDLLRAMRREGVQIPFILFTGKGREEVVIEAINEGATFYLQKGGDPRSLFVELAHKIRQAVAGENARKALLESEEKFRRLFETAFDGIILLSNFVIHDCNNQAAVMFGADKHRMIGSDFTLLSPDQQPDGAQTREKAYVLLEKALEEGGVIVTWKFKRWDGTVFDADMSISAFEIGGNIYYQAIIRDITDRIMAKQELEQRNADISAAYEKLIASGEELKVRLEELHRSQEMLKESQKKYKDLADMLPEGVFECTLDGKITYVNHHAYTLFGYDPGESFGDKNVLDFISSEERARAAEAIRSITIGISQPHEYEAVRSDGTTFPVIIHSAPIMENGVPVGIRGVIIDTSERRKVEHALQKSREELENLVLERTRALTEVNQELDYLANRLIEMNRELDGRVRERTAEVNRLLKQKDDFINQLGHDLKTPLTPLIALLPPLLRDEQDPEKRELYGVFLRSVYSMREQIEKILTLARISRQERVVEHEVIYPASLIRQAVEKLWFFIQQKNLVVEMLVPDDLAVSFSQRDASSVFENLLSNAIKYTNDGGRISVYAQADDQAVIITFEDTGIGLTTEEAIHVFDEFFMADRSRHDRQSSGLGLSIVKRVMECYGGRVWVESDGPGKGSRFMICLPIIQLGYCQST